MEINLSPPCERDLDLALLDLLTGWPEFRSWIAEQINCLQSDGALQQVAHSVMDAATGESDIELIWQDSRQDSVAILVENKINAAFQPRQAERYHTRGKSYLERGMCTSYRTLLFAPQSYIDADPERHGFHHALSYERVLDWLVERPAMPGLAFKQALLTAAIDKKRRGYQSVVDDEVTSFWRDSANLVQLLYPQLGFQYDGSDRPANADALTFRPAGFSKGLQLWLRALPGNQGYIQLLISRAAHKLEHIVSQLGELPSPGYQVIAAGKSAALRLAIDPINTHSPVASQADHIVAALAELEHLRGWTMDRLGIIDDLAD